MVEISLIIVWFATRKSEIAKPSPPKIEAMVNAKVEQLAHVLETILTVVPDSADLLNFSFKFLTIWRLKFTKIPTNIEFTQDNKNVPSISLGTWKAKNGKKNKMLSNMFVTTQKTIPVIEPIMMWIWFEKAVFRTRLIELNRFNFSLVLFFWFGK